MKMESRNNENHNAMRKTDIDGPRNYNNPEPLNTSLIGKSLTISMMPNKIESGYLRSLGQYTLELELPNKKRLIINKSAIITVVVNDLLR